MQKLLAAVCLLPLLSACISSGSPNPPASSTTVIAPPGSTVVCSDGTSPPCK